MKATLLLFLLLLPFPILAEDQWYDCDVHQFYVLGDEGNLQLKAAGYTGEVFRVDRKANVIVGSKINTIYNIDVVASNPIGSGVYSLVNYSRRDNGQIRRLSSLTVQDFGAAKPFVLTEGNYIFTGLCESV